MLEYAFVGTGGMMPLKHRYLASLLLRKDGNLFLIDCGEGTQISMKEISWGFKSLQAIFITHFHADHVSGLPGLLLTVGNSGKRDKLTLFGPPGLKKIVAGLLVIAPELPFPVEVVELEGQDYHFSFYGMEIAHGKMNHVLDCLAYRFYVPRQGRFEKEKAEMLKIPITYWSKLQHGETVFVDGKTFYPQDVLGEKRKGICLVYATDTRPNETIVRLAQHADVLICEGMHFDHSRLEKLKAYKHMLYQEAASLAKKASVKRLLLTHFSPAIVKPEEQVHVATEIFPKTSCAYDGYQAVIPFPTE